MFSLNLCRAFYKSWKTLRQTRPSRVIGMGGYISIPVCLAARVLRIPIHLYDLDAKPGKANRFLAKYADKIFVCFEQAKAYLPSAKCELTAYPIRFNPQVKQLSQEAAQKQLGLETSKKTLFINGGSQGSVSINARIKEWLELNPHVHSLIQIIHQTGAYDTTDWKAYYAQLDIPALTFSYRQDLAPCYSACDIIITRAGAGSLFEALFFDKQIITIPLETSSTAHQKDNAKALATTFVHHVTMITEQEIKKDNMILFKNLNRYIYNIPVNTANNNRTMNL